jgi:hypothetical protein
VLTPTQLQQAMDASRPMPYTPWWAISTLRPPPPVRPSEPPKPPPTEIVRTTSYQAPEAPAAVEDTSYLPSGQITSEVVPVWQALLDVSVWRSRPLWWRLAASLVVKRPNR